MNNYCLFITQSMLPDAMQFLSAGLIALTIAVAIFLVEKGSIMAFDRIVLLEKIIRGKSFIVFFLLLFLPLFLWDMSDPFVKTLLFAIYLIGVYGFATFLYRSYKWINEIESNNKRSHGGYRQKNRIEYLEEIGNDSQKQLAWEHIWGLENRSVLEERSYVESYVKVLTSLTTTKKVKLLDDYLIPLTKGITNVNFNDHIVVVALFKKLLETHSALFQSYVLGEKREAQDDYLQSARNALRNINLMLIAFTKKAASVGNLYLTLDTLRNFVESLQKDGDNEQYLRRLVVILAEDLFDSVDVENKRFGFENDFPSEWTYSKNKKTGRFDSLMTDLWFGQYTSWAKKRIEFEDNKKPSIDRKLDEVSRVLLPQLDPIYWSIILTFCLRPYWGDTERIKSAIEKHRTFGLTGNTYTYEADVEKNYIRDRSADIERTIDFSVKTFNREFTKERLKQYLKEIKLLEYDKNSIEEGNRVQILFLFEEMLKKIN